jgi:ADP-ribosylglycohydrolase
MISGAVIGDYVGSRFECRNTKAKAFDLFHYDCRYTDDTIMTIAVKEAMEKIIATGSDNNDARKIIVDSLLDWGRTFPSAGYGSSFSSWLYSADPQPYNSWGNGSAMRVSSVGWLFNTLEEVEHFATLSADVTHNHPEGIKGAQVIAGAIFIARTTHDKKAVRKYVESFGYKMTKLIFIRRKYKFDASCQGTVPVAVQAFLESTDFEDAIRNAVSMGGDSDTIAAITGSIAEAFYGLPNDLSQKADEIVRGIYETKNNWNMSTAI